MAKTTTDNLCGDNGDYSSVNHYRSGEIIQQIFNSINYGKDF